MTRKARMTRKKTMARMAIQGRGPDWTEMTRKTMRKVILSRQIERKLDLLT